MKILISKNNGFCNGVTSAVDLALNVKAKEGKKVYSYGEIVHNPVVVDKLLQNSIVVTDDLNILEEGDKLIIRSHGAHPKVYEYCNKKGIEIIDATCPFVKNIQNKAKTYYELGYQIVLVGSKNHPEIIGINGWCSDSAVVFNGEDICRINTDKNVLVLFQTTFDCSKVAAALKNIVVTNAKILEFFNTICYTTKDRQQFAEYSSKHSDFCVVVGGKNSSNTKKLYDIAKTFNKNSLWIENTTDLPSLSQYNTISLIAGASTPRELMEEVLSKMLKDAKDNAEVIELQPEQTTAGLASDQPEEQPAQQITAIEESVKPTDIQDEKPTTEKLEEQVVAQDEKPVEEQEKPVEKQEENPVEKPLEEESKKLEDTQVEKQEEKPAEKRVVTEKEMFKKAVEKFEKSPRLFRRGQKVKGKVVLKNDESVFVSIDSKREGVIPNDQLSLNDDIDEVKASLKVGDKIECIVISTDKGITLSKKELEILYKDDEKVEGIKNGEQFEVTIKQDVKGGLLARLGSFTVFIPSSHIKMGFAKDLKQYVGKNMTLLALPDGIDENKKKIVASHKAIIEKERKEKEDNFWNNIDIGEIVEGKVLRFAAFGAFVSVRGVDCLAHLSDLSWNPVKSPDEILEIGKVYEFVVLKLDRPSNRISIGYKQLQPHPWQIAAEKYVPGYVLTGKIARILPYGAFIDLGNGIDGLLHISNVSWDWLSDINQALKVGDDIEVQVVECDAENKRITLSRKALIPQPDVVKTQESVQESFEEEQLPVAEDTSEDTTTE